MWNKLLNYTKRILKDQRGFIVSAPLAATLGAAALTGGGIAGAATAKGGQWYNPFSWFGGGGGQQKQQQATAQYFDPYPDQRKQLMDLLYQGSQTGVPGLAQYGQQRWQEQMPGIRELYEGKRQLGKGSTPEIAALGQASRGLATDITGLQSQAQQRYAQMYSGALGQPTTAVTPYQQQPGMFENLLQFGAPIASSYMQNQAMMPLWKQLFGGEDPARDIMRTQPLYGG